LSFTVRPAVASDGPSLGRFGAALAGQHHQFDSRRFMLPGDVEAGYRRWLLKEAASPHAVVLVAERDAGQLLGYAYGTLEARDWNLLLDAHGGFHDLWVDDSARCQGVGAQLAEALVQRLRALGAPRVVLMTAAQNQAAQKLFARLGWRTTMLEMTREL